MQLLSMLVPPAQSGRYVQCCCCGMSRYVMFSYPMSCTCFHAQNTCFRRGPRSPFVQKNASGWHPVTTAIHPWGWRRPLVSVGASALHPWRFFFAEGEVLRTPWAGVLGHTEDGWPPAVSVPSESGGCPSSRPICRSLTGRDGWRSPPPKKKK